MRDRTGAAGSYGAVRGSAKLDAQVLKHILDLIADAVDHVLGEYPGFMCERKNM